MTTFNTTKIHVLGLLLVAAVAGSCKKLIEIPANPPTAISQQEQFSDSATSMTAVVGVYTYASSGHGFMYNDGYLAISTGLSSDELSYPGTSNADMVQFNANTVTDLNGTVGTLWGDPYTGLYQVNAVLENVGAAKTLSASFKTQVMAEMKVMRALYYFYTINLFGPVPLVLSTDYSQTVRLPRASTDAVYAQIIADLNDAKKGLTAAYPSAGRVRPNLYVALSLLAKVQLYRQQWQAAYDAADAVITSGLYSLNGNLDGVFLDGSGEAIWQVPAAGNSAVTAEASQFIPYSGNTVPNYLIAPSLLNAFEAGDLRRQHWIKDYVVTSSGTSNHYYAPYKYKVRNPVGATTNEDYMVFRLAELYLVRAEAAAQLGKAGGALADLNLVRQRAGLSPSGAVTQADILTAIAKERQVELFTEWGSRWFDLKRTGAVDAVLGAVKMNWQPYKALFPVPRTQLQFNNQLVQNAGY